MTEEFKEYILLKDRGVPALEAAKIADQKELDFIQIIRMLREVYEVNSLKEAKKITLESREVDLEEHSKSIVQALEIVFKEIREQEDGE